MIDFRYHVVSLVAVLLALATGILLGSSVLSGPLYDRLEATTDRVVDERDQLQEQVRELEQDKAFGTAFAEEALPELVSARLAGQRVLLVTLPGAEQATVNEIAGVLEAAGASVTGELAITDAYAMPDQESVLDSLVSQLVWPDLELPADGSPYDRAAAEIAAVVATAEVAADPDELPGPGRVAELTDGSEDQSSNGEAQVLPGLRAAGFVETSTDDPLSKASQVVVVTGPAPEEPTDDTRRANGAHLSLARALDAGSSGVVMAGPSSSATAGGLLAALRGGDDAATVSSIDVANSPIGRIAIVYALNAEENGVSGHYGTEGTTDGPLPSPGTGSDDS